MSRAGRSTAPVLHGGNGRDHGDLSRLFRIREKMNIGSKGKRMFDPLQCERPFRRQVNSSGRSDVPGLRMRDGWHRSSALHASPIADLSRRLLLPRARPALQHHTDSDARSLPAPNATMRAPPPRSGRMGAGQSASRGSAARPSHVPAALARCRRLAPDPPFGNRQAKRPAPRLPAVEHVARMV